jgi:hypothetical protein
MSRKHARGKAGLPREKTAGMRKDYFRQIARVDASDTVDSQFFVSAAGEDSTVSRPSVEAAPGVGMPPGFSSLLRRPLMPKWASYGVVIMGAITLLAGGIWAVASMKSDIAENRERIRSVEKSADLREASFQRELERLGRLIEKTASNVQALLQAGSKRGR